MDSQLLCDYQNIHINSTARVQSFVLAKCEVRCEARFLETNF